MATLLERGAKWFRSKLPDAAAVTVSIRADNDVLDSIQAIPGRRDFAQYIVDSAAGTAEVFDWIVAEQDLIFSSVKLQPQAGWEIWYVREDGETAVFTVRPGNGTRVFDVVDQLGLMYRIHTEFDRLE